MPARNTAGPSAPTLEPEKSHNREGGAATIVAEDGADASTSAAGTWALAYAKRGWHVFPVFANKVPATPNGVADATTDEATIRSWWRQWPYAQPGLGCKLSGVVAIDVDEHHDGGATWQNLRGVEPHGAVLVASTPRGGRHYLYAAPEGAEIRSPQDWQTGIDVKAGGGDHGGYVVLPHGSEARQWIEGDPLDGDDPGPLPAWLYDLLPKVGDEPAPRSEAANEEWARLAAGVGEGERHAATIKLAGHYLGHGLSEAEALVLCLAQNEKCQPPRPAADVERDVRDIARRDRQSNPGRYAPDVDMSGLSQPAGSTPAAVLAQWRKEGPLLHEPTGIPQLDDMTGGGLVYGGRYYVGGAPDAGKTLLCAQVADTWAARGLAVGILSVDEEPGDLLTRFLQRRGWRRSQCEARDPTDLDQMARELSGLPLYLYGQDYTIEEAAADLAARAEREGRRAALFVDSLQTARCAGEASDASMHVAVTARTKAIRRVAIKYGLIVVVTSELGRAAYRSNERHERTADMAAGKESGSIEYAARVWIVLRSVPGKDGVVEARLAKNKLGRTTRSEEHGIMLEINLAGQAVRQVDYVPENDTDGDQRKAAAHNLQTTKDAAIVAAVVAGRPGIESTELESAAAVAAGGMGKRRHGCARSLLGAALQWVKGVRTARHFHLDGSQVPPDVLAQVPIEHRPMVLASRAPEPPEPGSPSPSEPPQASPGGSTQAPARDTARPPLGGGGVSRGVSAEGHVSKAASPEAEAGEARSPEYLGGAA